MAQYVTQIDTDRGPRDRRMKEIFERFGDMQVRGSQRDSEAVFAKGVAAKGRLPIRQVRRHVCLHDEGQPTCTGEVIG